MQELLDDDMMGLTWLADHETQVRRLIRKMCRRRGWRHRQDDAWSECVDRAPRIARTYDPLHPSGASLSTHMLANLRWYVWKMLRKSSREGRLPSGLGTGDRQLDDTVQCYLERLQPAEALVLHMRFVDGMTLGQIARVLDAPKSTVQARSKRAIEALRDGRSEP